MTNATASNLILEAARLELQGMVIKGSAAANYVSENIGRRSVTEMWHLEAQLIEMAAAEPAQMILDNIDVQVADGKDIDEATRSCLAYYAEHWTERLFNGWLDPNSTNELSNGFQAIERAAYRHLVRTIRDFVR